MLVVPGSVWALAGGWGLVVIMNGCLIGLSPAIFIDRGHDHNRCRDSIDISTQNVMSNFKDAFCCKSNLGGVDTEASLPIAEVSPKNIFFN